MATSYTYTAYSDSACTTANELATATAFTTLGVSVSSLGNSRNGALTVGTLAGSQGKAAAQFTTGASAGGYELSSITFKTDQIDPVYGSPGNLTVAIYDDSSGKPGSSEITLSGSNPTGAGEYTYTCSSSCTLAGSAKYHLVLEAPNATGTNNNYGWESSASGSEVTVPSGNGWSIGKSFSHSSNTWSDYGNNLKFKVTATVIPSLTVSGVSATGATLTIDGHSAAWYYKADTAPHTTCQGPVTAGTKTKALTGLSANTSYTYTAYSDSACTTANEVATAAAFITGITVSTLAGAQSGTVSIGWDGSAAREGAQAFTTGSNSGGYTLAGVTISFAGKSGSPASLNVELKPPAKLNSSNPVSKAGFTLSGSSPSSAGSYWYNCDSGCDLSANTTYFINMKSAGIGGYYSAALTGAAEVKNPSTNGWSIDDDGRVQTGSTWGDAGSSVAFKMEIEALLRPSLDASSITATGATLTIAGHAGDWYYKANAAPDNTCKGPVSGTTKTLSGLSMATSYTYTAYRDSACTTDNLVATETFNTPGVSVSSLGNSRNGVLTVGTQAGSQGKAAAQFTVGSNSGGYELSSITFKADQIYPKHGNPGDLTVAIYSNGSDNKPGTSQITLSGSNPTVAGEYTYTCTTSQTNDCTLAGSAKYHLVLEAPNATGTSNNYGWETSASGSEVLVPSGNGWSIGKSFSHSSNTWSDYANNLKFKVSATVNASLDSSGVTATGATLTISHHGGGDWYYKANAAPDNTCQGPVSGTTKTLSGLSVATSYTYTAYSDSTCTTANELATAAAFTTLGVSVSSLGNARGGALGVGSQGNQARKAAAQFTTGANNGGYELTSVTFKTDQNNPVDGSPGNLTVSIYSNGNDNKPDSSQITLSGSNPTAAGEFTYTCTDTLTNDCTLAKETKYHLVLEAPNATGNNRYGWEASTSSSEVLAPTGNGWSIGDSFSHSSSAWHDYANYMKFKVSATLN